MKVTDLKYNVRSMLSHPTKWTLYFSCILCLKPFSLSSGISCSPIQGTLDLFCCCPSYDSSIAGAKFWYALQNWPPNCCLAQRRVSTGFLPACIYTVFPINPARTCKEAAALITDLLYPSWGTCSQVKFQNSVSQRKWPSTCTGNTRCNKHTGLRHTCSNIPENSPKAPHFQKFLCYIQLLHFFIFPIFSSAQVQ